MNAVSELFDVDRWREVPGFESLTDVTYHLDVTGAWRASPSTGPRSATRSVRTPSTSCTRRSTTPAGTRRSASCSLTGNGPSPKDGGRAFCSGGDQRVRGAHGYTDAVGAGRLHILEVQRLIRTMPKVVVAVVNGWAAGGGHSLAVVCDLTIASREHGRFKQTDADVGSFDAGYGSTLLARQVGQKRAREIFFLAREYSADEAYAWSAINASVPHESLETTALEWAETILGKSPTAIRLLKFALNAADDGLVGQQVFAGEATRLAYGRRRRRRAVTPFSGSARRTGRRSPGSTEAQ